MKRHIPNIITLCNLVCGCVAVLRGFEADYSGALLWICAGALFDFFDGFAARLLGVSSPVGKELDSLADNITFGLAPSAICFSLIADGVKPDWHTMILSVLPYLAFVMSAMSGLRLAKFNLDERQATGFLGLPTPANALFWSALAVGAQEWLATSPWAVWTVLLGVFVMSFLLVSEIPMFALKFKHFGLQGNGLRYGFIVCSAVMLLFLGLTGLALIIPLYVIVSIIAAVISRKRVGA